MAVYQLQKVQHPDPSNQHVSADHVLDSNNPLGYKFSWSSRGVLLALKNNARYFENGKLIEVNGVDLMGTAKPYPTGFLGFSFVAYGNRDSTGYRER